MESSNKVACLDKIKTKYGSGGSYRKKTTGEQLKSAFSIHKDAMDHNLKSSPGEEFFNFMGMLLHFSWLIDNMILVFMIIFPVINFLVMIIAASARDSTI